MEYFYGSIYGLFLKIFKRINKQLKSPTSIKGLGFRPMWNAGGTKTLHCILIYTLWYMNHEKKTK